MIQLESVSKYYGDTKAVDNISLSVTKGETVILLGTSGCGKTTTLRMINRLAEPSSGSIIVNGQNIWHQSPEQLRRGIGYVLQHHGLFPHYTVFENIAIVPKLLKWKKEEITNRVGELLNKLKLPKNISNQYPAELSGGQQQRVGLARALAANPPLLLMDEPLGALDPVTRADIRREFTSMEELKKKTILMVTHDVQEAFELGDRICLMDKGKIVQIGSQAELLFKPVNSFVSEFLKDQRFQLELETVTIKDLWQLLPKAIDGTEEQQLPDIENLWQIIEMLSAVGQPVSRRFVATINSEKKQIEMASLMAAYTQYKNSLQYE